MLLPQIWKRYVEAWRHVIFCLARIDLKRKSSGWTTWQGLPVCRLPESLSLPSLHVRLASQALRSSRDGQRAFRITIRQSTIHNQPQWPFTPCFEPTPSHSFVPHSMWVKPHYQPTTAFHQFTICNAPSSFPNVQFTNSMQQHNTGTPLGRCPRHSSSAPAFHSMSLVPQ